MSIVRNSGIRQATVATERGWETPDGKLVSSSRNLLSNRVARGFATPEEVKRWSHYQLIEIEDRSNKVFSTLEVNEARLKGLTDKFEQEHDALAKSENINLQIQYHHKKIEHLNVVAQYEKSFKASRDELEKLNIRRDRIQAKLDTVLAVVPSLTGANSEQKVVHPAPVQKQEVQSNKPAEPKKVEILQKEKPVRKKWTEARREKEAAKKAAKKAEAEAKLGAGYPVAEPEIIPD